MAGYLGSEIRVRVDLSAQRHLPRIAATEIRELAEGKYLDQVEPVIFIEDYGTGKTHLASGLCVARLAWGLA